jgi:DNA-binding PadR family transcriptional regulator
MHRHHHHFHDHDFDPRQYAGRHRHGRGFGHFSGGFMGGMGFGGHGFRTGRKLGSNELQVILLALLEARPSHGYELIKTLEERSGGFYSPSPGMVYPALTYLEEVGHVSAQADGAKKLYSITDTGREYLKSQRESADAILAQLERIGSKMGRVREIFSGDETDADEGHGGSGEVWSARRELKAALREKHHAGPREARRIASILLQAAAQIREEG